MDSELSNLLKELLVVIDELRVIDSPEIVSRLQSEGVNDGLMYTADFVDTYEAIRQRLVELGELPAPPNWGLWRINPQAADKEWGSQAGRLRGPNESHQSPPDTL